MAAVATALKVSTRTVRKRLARIHSEGDASLQNGSSAPHLVANKLLRPGSPWSPAYAATTGFEAAIVLTRTHQRSALKAWGEALAPRNRRKKEGCAGKKARRAPAPVVARWNTLRSRPGPSPTDQAPRGPGRWRERVRSKPWTSSAML